MGRKDIEQETKQKPTHHRKGIRVFCRANRSQAVLGGARPSGEFPVRALGYSGTGDSGGLSPPLWDGDVGMGATGPDRD